MVCMAHSLAVCSFNADGVLQHNAQIFHNSAVKMPNQKFLGNLQDNIRVSVPFKLYMKSFIGQIGYPSRKKTNLVVSAGWSLGDENIGDSMEPPQYTSYIDSNTGEPVPTMGARPSIPDKKFWSEDSTLRMRSAQASFPSGKLASTSKPSNGQKPGSRRKNFRERAAVRESSVEETVDNEPELENLNYSSEEVVETSAHVIYEPETDEETVDAEELTRKYGEPHSFVRPSGKQLSRLSNEELWPHWRKPPPGKERWSEWKKRAPHSDTVMAKAMAEIGQIKLFGDWPTIAETSLARARKRVFKKERLKDEEERKKELGAMAYYQEWVKAWDKDTSKEAVQKHFEETGEDVHEQLSIMFQHQTDREYRIMMGTDLRIRRDPLTMRMRPELKKAVFGGDPVYPTVNYEQDPDHIVDYRGPNFHEPVPEILDYLEQIGRLAEDSNDELDKQEGKDTGHEELDKAMAGAIDIGEKDDEYEDEDEDEDEEDDITDSMSAGTDNSSLEKDEIEGDEMPESISDQSSQDEDEIEEEEEEGDDVEDVDIPE